MRGALSDHIAGIALVDHHVHGCWTAAGDRRRFENALNEANTEPLADFDSAFDTLWGFARRRPGARVGGRPRHAPPAAYGAARCESGALELARLFMGAAGVSDWLVDTGLDGVAGVTEVELYSGGRAHEVVRLERVAEDAAAAGGDYAAEFERILSERATKAVGLKSILAYRGGFVGDLSEPGPAAVREAAARWRDNGGRRLTDRVLLRFGLHRALRTGKPIQFHVGLGDRDCDLHTTNPMHLIDFLRVSGDTPVVLLHCYPYEREAGYLAQAFNNVYLDGGLAINHLGARSAAFVRRLLELAPFRKILYSSDGFGPAELHFLGARLWRDGIAGALGDFVAADEWAPADALRVADLIGYRNAARVYRLPIGAT